MRAFYAALLWLLIGVAVGVGLGLTRQQWLPGVGAWLDVSEVQTADGAVDVIFVLSGSASDRASAAAHLYQIGLAQKLVFTGQLTPEPVRALGLDTSEAALGRLVALRLGVPDSAISVVRLGTSTHEECLFLRDTLQKATWGRVGVLSHRFHTRRIRWQLKRLFTPAELARVHLYGASATEYNENTWWRTEAGLLFVFNEYLKLGYYLVTY